MLTTVDQVILALGGPTQTGKLVGRSPQVVVNWRRKGLIPAEYRDALLSALNESGHDAPPALWGMVERVA
jgi:hypothetical protein